jgi:DNA-binding Lrp family transcriptional regulator
MRSTPGALLLDPVDWKILRELELNACQQNQDLARTVGLSPSGTLHRVRRLHQSGAIRRYITDIDLTDVERWLHFIVEVELTPEGRANAAQFEAALAGATAILNAHQTMGRADYVLNVTGPDPSIWPMTLAAIDPTGALVARAQVHLCVREAKIFAGHPQLRQSRGQINGK